MVVFNSWNKEDEILKVNEKELLNMQEENKENVVQGGQGKEN